MACCIRQLTTGAVVATVVLLVAASVSLAGWTRPQASKRDACGYDRSRLMLQSQNRSKFMRFVGHGSKPGYTEESESGVGWEGVSAICTECCTELCSRLK